MVVVEFSIISKVLNIYAKFASFTHFSRQNFETFVVSHTFLALTVAKLSTLTNSPDFWSTLHYM